MKKLILTTAMAFVMILSMNAQNSSLLIGINAGANFSKLSYSGDFRLQGADEMRRLGFQGGLDIGFKYNSFALITGLQYSQRGGKVELKNTDVNNPFVFVDGISDTGIYKDKVRMTQMSIPLLLRYQTKGKLAFTVTLGPSINFGVGKVTSQSLFELENNTDKGPFDEEYTLGDGASDLVKKSSVGFVFSPGLLYKVNDKGYFRAGIAYVNGGNIANPNASVQFEGGGGAKLNGAIKSTSLVFGIGYEHRIDFTMGAKY